MMLTPLELDIMKAVWRRAPISVRNVQLAIRPSRPLAYTTVMTIMDRLRHKGFLTRKFQGRTHFYEPVISYGDVRNEAVSRLIEDFFDGSRENLREFLEGNSNGQSPEHGVVSLPPSTTLDETLL
jgi:predicted transcriptional regulator